MGYSPHRHEFATGNGARVFSLVCLSGGSWYKSCRSNIRMLPVLCLSFAAAGWVRAGGFNWPTNRFLPTSSTPETTIGCIEVGSASGAVADLLASLGGIANLADGDPIGVSLAYDGRTLSMTLTDTVTNAASRTYVVANIVGALETKTAYVQRLRAVMPNLYLEPCGRDTVR
jgi:hypothetical protein